MSIKTFMGANTPWGFSSLFDELHNPYKDERLYIIKGGAGTGKSSLMKKIAKSAEEAGYETEKVYCSSDPQSLDGLIIPELDFSIADGTAPHVIEPRFPGASENIINMGQFWNEKELFEKRKEIKALSVENSMYHRSSERLLFSAGTLKGEISRLFASKINKEKIESYAVRFASRETPKKKNSPPGKKKRRYLSAITPKGKIFFDETVETLCSRIIAVRDDYGEVGSFLCERIGELAVKNGYEVIFCLCPMKKGVSEHIIIPEIALGIITVNACHEINLSADRVIHAERFLTASIQKENKNKLLWSRTISEELIDEAVLYLKKAKQTHDRLEKLYIESMDFEKVNAFEKKFISRLIQK